MTERPTLPQLLDDLRAEEQALDDIVARLDAAGWSTATPAAGWDVRDSIGHLAWAEEMAATAIHEPDAFRAYIDNALANIDQLADHAAGRHRQFDGPGTLAWWREVREKTIAGLVPLDGKDRVMWIEGPMSAMSFTTARIMETWAHGQDIVDGLGAESADTPRLRHVADIGVRTRPFAYRARGLDLPDGDVRVELEGPGGATWTWGDEAAVDRVSGPAIDFCLVATQRRNVADTRLKVAGPLAAEWMEIAQAFAGPPTPTRAAGSFSPPR